MIVHQSPQPFLLHFAERTEPFPVPESRYDPETQCEEGGGIFCGTNRGQSYQNRTTGYSVATAYEDADDEMVYRND